MSLFNTLIIAGSLLAISMFLFFMGIVRRRVGVFIWSVLFFIAAAGFVVYGMAMAAKRSIQYVTNKRRGGMDIYTAALGKPVTNCVKVLHHKDKLVPRLDCCIWLEFTTCPEELRRIAAHRAFSPRSFATADTGMYTKAGGAAPEWWQPYTLGDTVYMLSDVRPEDPNHSRFLLFGKDSSRGYYCEMMQ